MTSSSPQNFHGFTVIIYTRGPMTYVGRWDEQIGDQIFLNDVSVHRDGDEGINSEEFVRRTAQFGPRVMHKRLAVPSGEVTCVRTLGEVSLDLFGI